MIFLEHHVRDVAEITATIFKEENKFTTSEQNFSVILSVSLLNEGY
jgi:hypothetical protein